MIHHTVRTLIVDLRNEATDWDPPELDELEDRSIDVITDHHEAMARAATLREVATRLEELAPERAPMVITDGGLSLMCPHCLREDQIIECEAIETMHRLEIAPTEPPTITATRIGETDPDGSASLFCQGCLTELAYPDPLPAQIVYRG